VTFEEWWEDIGYSDHDGCKWYAEEAWNYQQIELLKLSLRIEDLKIQLEERKSK